jgi:hypothetical protein
MRTLFETQCYTPYKSTSCTHTPTQHNTTQTLTLDIHLILLILHNTHRFTTLAFARYIHNYSHSVESPSSCLTARCAHCHHHALYSTYIAFV